MFQPNITKVKQIFMRNMSNLQYENLLSQLGESELKWFSYISLLYTTGTCGKKKHT